MFDVRTLRAGVIASVLALTVTAMPAQAGDGVWPDIRDARQDYRADTRDLHQEFRVERREDFVDWHNGEYDGRGELYRDRAGDRSSVRQQHRIDRREFRQDVRQIVH